LVNTRDNALVLVAAAGASLFHAAMYGPHALNSELFRTRFRYSGASLGDQIAGVPGGALVPIISIALRDWFGT
jgi:hypothetical protein